VRRGRHFLRKVQRIRSTYMLNPVQSSRSLSHLAGEALQSMSLLTAELINEIELDRADVRDRLLRAELENLRLRDRISELVELEERHPSPAKDQR